MASKFAAVEINGVTIWSGRPDCQAGHDAVLAWLRQHAGPFLSPSQVRDHGNILRGNLGESIAYCVSFWHDCGGYRVWATNAARPFRPKSDIDIDIVWLAFAENVRDDFAIIQEVKTTNGTDLAYGNELIADYDKLYGTNPRLTLHTRLQDIKVDLLFKCGPEGKELSQRVSRLAGQNPQTSPRIQLRPTLVHEREGTKPVNRMTAIRTTLLGKGWSPDAVEAWAIGLTGLDARLTRLAIGKN